MNIEPRKDGSAEGWLEHALWLAQRADWALEKARRAEIRDNAGGIGADPNDTLADVLRGDRSVYS